eukprot:gene3360-3849_t
MSEFQDSFALFDKKGDGMISSNQIGDVLRALGLNPLLSEVHKLQKEIDPDGEKRLSFDEFLPIYHEQKDKQPVATVEAFVEAFRIFDLDSNGLISAGEVRHLLTMLGERLSNDEVDVLLHGIEDASGKIHYEDFVKEILKS